jgi:hypothetical protein
VDLNCNRASFVEDVTVPDGTLINAGEKFTKTWRFKNIGNCTWTKSYKFVFVGGDKMGAPTSVSLPAEVLPNNTIDVSIDLVAPQTPGKYKGIWSFEDEKGQRFGLGASGKGEIWVQVEVGKTPTSTPTSTPEPAQLNLPTVNSPFVLTQNETLAFDFVSQACAAEWTNANGAQPCPRSGGEADNISVITLPALEDGTTLNYPAVAIKPGGANGFVTGIYPEVQVQPGDHFRAIASCEADATTCSVLFRVSYQEASGNIVDLWAVGEFYDQKYTVVDLDLSALVGQKVKFILNVSSLNSDANVRVLWAAPGIYRLPIPTATPTLTPTSTATATATPTLTPTLTATVTPAPTATPVPQPLAQPSGWDKFQQFINDLFKKIFGG